MVWFFSLGSASFAWSQYDQNPLQGKRWATLGAGLNTADNVSWQTMLSYSKRGETMLTQVRLGYSQEFIESKDDTCTERKNRIIETGVLWGDGWAGRKWYITGAVGFGLNVRMYCADADYGGFRYLTAVTIGVPASIECGFMATKDWGLGIQVVGNWNFRQPYIGGQLAWHYRF
jgi:hypothetical protein